MSEKFKNPMGTDGFAFIEFCSNHPERLMHDFHRLGFSQMGKHRRKHALLFRQGAINFILNLESNGFAAEFAGLHGASACAMGFRVKNASQALRHALQKGAKAFTEHLFAADEVAVPAIYGIGGSLIYFIDDTIQHALEKQLFLLDKPADKNPGVGLTYIDHLTHNVRRGEMDVWAKFYEDIFNFREIRYFDIKGKVTGLISRALTSPCGKIRIPINESTDDKSQIEEFIQEFNGEGIQHIALGTDNIYESVETMRGNGIQFLETPDTYYEMLESRIPWHQEDMPRLKKNRILMDGGKTVAEGLLLQIFTQNMLGPVFFEIIQRKGNEGFGEGNFQALFEAIELDQMRRGRL